VALVLAAEDIDLDAEPEEGIAAEIASAHDALQDAGKKVRMAETGAAEASEVPRKQKKNCRRRWQQRPPQSMKTHCHN